MASNRKTTLFTRQDGTKLTVPPNHVNEMSHDQIDMVSGSFGVIANNTNLNVFANNFTDGTSPILADKNSKIEVEQSLSTGKNNEIDNSKFVVALENNNIQVDDKSETNSKTRITRKSATDISNSTNFPSPNPGYVDIYKTVNEQNPALINTDIIAAAEVVNNGIDTEMAALSTGILLQDTTIDLSTTYKQFYNVDISKSGTNFTKFLNNLPRDLNGKTLTFKFNNNFTDTCIFNRFYGGTIDLQGTYSGLIEFTECQNVIFNKFTANNILTFTDCDNVILSGGTYQQLNVYRSKCHCIKSSFKGNPIVADNEGAQVLFDQCTLNNNKLITFSKGSQVSSINRVSTTQELLDKNFTSETKAGMNSNKDIENLTNHFHITAEHINNTYPIGSVYGWPRAYTRGDIKRAINGNVFPDTYQVGVIPTIAGLTSNYLPSGDLPLDMSGSYNNKSPYVYGASNYQSTHGVTPVGIQTSTGKTTFCSFDWYKLYNDNNPGSGFAAGYPSSSVYDDINNNNLIKESNLKNERNIYKEILTSNEIYLSLYEIDPDNVHARRRASITLSWSIAENGFAINTIINGNNPDINIKLKLNLSGLKNYIPSNLLDYAYISFYVTGNKNSDDDGVKTYYYSDLENGKETISFTGYGSRPWSLNNIILYVPYVSITSKIHYISISLQNPLKNVPGNQKKSVAGNARYDYDMGPQNPEITSYIQMSPASRNSNITQDDWYLFSDTILNIKTGNSYRSKDIDNYKEYVTVSGNLYEEILSSYYFTSNFGNSVSYLVHDIGTNTTELLDMNKSTMSGLVTVTTSPQIYTKAVAGLKNWHYETINETLVRFNKDIPSSVMTPEISVTNTFNILNFNTMYDFTDSIQFISGTPISAKFFPLKPRSTAANSKKEYTKSVINEAFVTNVFPESDNDILQSPLEFQNVMVRMIARHELLCSCDEVFDIINGLNITSDIYKYDNYTTNGVTSAILKEKANSSYPPSSTNYWLSGFSGEAKLYFEASVGAAYPMITGNLLSNSEMLSSGINFSLHNPKNEYSYTYLPFSSAPTKLNETPAYFGIPYLIHDNYGSITYDDDNGTENECDTFVGGQTELNKINALKGYVGTALSWNSSLNLTDSDAKKGFFARNIELPKINNIWKIHNKLYNGDIKFPLKLHYTRLFELNNRIDLYKINLSYKNMYSNANLFSKTAEDTKTLENVCSLLANEIYDDYNNVVNYNNSVIIITYTPKPDTNGVAYQHVFTNISNENYISVYDTLKDYKSEINGFSGSYKTTITFNNAWEWEIFYRYYTHKLFFVMSKLNRYYRKALNTSNLEKLISTLNIIKFSKTTAFTGCTGKIRGGGGEFDTTSDVGPDIVRIIGQLIYPVGQLETDTRRGITYVRMNYSTGIGIGIDKNHLFVDRGKWGENDYSMNSICSGDHYNQITNNESEV